MIIMSNHEPTGKWNVAGCSVTCISNCVLGNGGLNAIDSWGVQHYAAQRPQLSANPSNPIVDSVWYEAKKQLPATMLSISRTIADLREQKLHSTDTEG